MYEWLRKLFGGNVDSPHVDGAPLKDPTPVALQAQSDDGFNSANIQWTESFDPPVLYRLEYADRHGEYSKRIAYLGRRGQAADGREYIGIYEKGKFKTLRADRVLSMSVELDEALSSDALAPELNVYEPLRSGEQRSVTLMPEHIRFLAALMRSRPASYFAEQGENWSSSMNESWEDVLLKFATAGLITSGVTKKNLFLITAKGAAVVADHCEDPVDRAYAKKKMRELPRT